MRSSIRLALLCSLSVFVATAAQAQIIRSEGIQASGTASVRLRPETMRLRMELVARGESIADAMAMLKVLIERDRKQIQVLGAIPESIRFGDPGIRKNQPIDGAQAANEDQNENDAPKPAAANAAAANAPPAEAAAAAPARQVTASMSLTADWELKARDPIELAVEIGTLQQKIRDADLSKTNDGNDDGDGDDPQEEEENNRFGLMPALSPGVAKYLFVAHLPLDEQKKCAARAYARAKRDAEILAAGAGTPLQRLRSLRVPAFMEEGAYEMYNPDVSSTSALVREENIRREDDEVWGKNWRALDFEIKVVATFDVGDEEKR